MKTRELISEIWLPAPISRIFEFFSNPANLDVITPPWLHFRMLTSEPTIHAGALLDYRLKIHGVPVSWQSKIEIWEPPHRFVDTQSKGPYRKWVHTHEFQGRENGTLIIDRVEYALYGWIFEPLVNRFLVRPDVESIFEYRRNKLREIFGKDHRNLLTR